MDEQANNEIDVIMVPALKEKKKGRPERFIRFMRPNSATRRLLKTSGAEVGRRVAPAATNHVTLAVYRARMRCRGLGGRALSDADDRNGCARVST
jgi:hypothetical protein